MIRVAINGFGRIGRLFFRQAFGRPGFEIVAINDLGSAENLAYLLKYDTVYHRYPADVRVQEGNLVVQGKTIRFLQVKDPAGLPWRDLAADVVVESTGAFESFEKAKAHIDAGARRVVLTAPAKDADGAMGRTVLMGVNEGDLKGCAVSSNGSCTTNASASVIQILHETFGIEKAILSTVHGYTATQTLVDGPVKGTDFRRGRAAAQNITPSSTGAAIAVTRAVKDLAGKFDGVSMRVPIAAGSLADTTCVLRRDATVEEVNEAFRNAAALPRWQGIMRVSDEELVSSDIIGEPYGAIVDAKFTKVIGGNLVKVLSWYDNEWGYVATLVRHVAAAGMLK